MYDLWNMIRKTEGNNYLKNYLIGTTSPGFSVLKIIQFGGAFEERQYQIRNTKEGACVGNISLANLPFILCTCSSNSGENE